MALTWNGPACVKIVEEATFEGIARAAKAYAEYLDVELDVSAKIGRGTKNKDYEASKPGEPPRKRTGKLQRNVMYELDRENMRARIGVSVNAIYGLFLEFGTRKMQPRPWLVATLRKYWDAIRAQLMIGGGVQ